MWEVLSLPLAVAVEVQLQLPLQARTFLFFQIMLYKHKTGACCNFFGLSAPKRKFFDDCYSRSDVEFLSKVNGGMKELISLLLSSKLMAESNLVANQEDQ